LIANSFIGVGQITREWVRGTALTRDIGGAFAYSSTIAIDQHQMRATACTGRRHYLTHLAASSHSRKNDG
jgi:hypothetical protein